MTYEELEAKLEGARRVIELQDLHISYQQQEIEHLVKAERRARRIQADERWCWVLIGAFGAAAIMMVGFLLPRIF